MGFHSGALSIVFQSNFLHWSDATSLGGTSKGNREVWKEHRESCMLPLLNLLESMVGEHGHYGTWCNNEVSKLPLRAIMLDKNYKNFSSNIKKCKAMVLMIQICVENMHSYNFCLEDPSNPDKNKECSPRCCLPPIGTEFVDMET